jgi:hypothetical protein
MLSGFFQWWPRILGWKAMRAELMRTGASPELLADLATGWYLGSVAMEARGKGPSGRVTAATIALVYSGFGMLAFVFRSFDLHFLVGSALGCGRRQIQVDCFKIGRPFSPSLPWHQ